MLNKDSLYIERYVNGHLRGCDRALPELRSNIFSRCTCEEILKGERIRELRKDRRGENAKNHYT